MQFFHIENLFLYNKVKELQFKNSLLGACVLVCEKGYIIHKEINKEINKEIKCVLSRRLSAMW